MAHVEWQGGTEHWTTKDDIRLFLWQKPAAANVPFAGTILFVHGSSMASQPTFDLSVPGRPDSSVMDWFARRGFDTWCMDNEGYGRSDKHRPINFDIANGADDLDVDRLGKGGELFQFVLDAPDLVGKFDGDQQCLLRSGLGGAAAVEGLFFKVGCGYGGSPSSPHPAGEGLLKRYPGNRRWMPGYS